MATLEMTGITSLCNGISNLVKDFPLPKRRSLMPKWKSWKPS